MRSLFLLVVATLGAPPGSSGGEVSFSREIAPIFFRKCQACHGPEKAKGDFRLHTYQELRRGGESKKPTIVPGDPAASHLYQLITAEDEDDRMPQKDDPLSTNQVALIKAWIEAGAPFDGADPSWSLRQLIPQPPHPAPPGDYARLIPIRALAVPAGGKEIAAGGYHEVTLWDSEGGKLLSRITNIPERVSALVYGHGSNTLFIAGGAPGRSGEVKVFDRAAERLTAVPGAFPDMVLAMDLNPAHTRLVVGAADNSIRVYEVPSLQLARTIEQHSDWVMGVAFSHDGKKIASVSRDKTARIFDSETGEMQASCQGHTAPVYAVAFSSDDKQLFTAGAERKIRIWSVDEGKQLRESPDLSAEIFSLLLDNGKLFGAGGRRMVQEFRTDNLGSARMYRDAPDDLCVLAYDAAGGRLLAGTFTGEVVIWEVGRDKPLQRFVALPGWKGERAGGSGE